MLSVLFSIIQHEQYYLIILLIGLKAATSLKKKDSGTFVLSFVDPRKKPVEKLVYENSYSPVILIKMEERST